MSKQVPYQWKRDFRGALTLAIAALAGLAFAAVILAKSASDERWKEIKKNAGNSGGLKRLFIGYILSCLNLHLFTYISRITKEFRGLFYHKKKFFLTTTVIFKYFFGRQISIHTKCNNNAKPSIW